MPGTTRTINQIVQSLFIHEHYSMFKDNTTNNSIKGHSDIWRLQLRLQLLKAWRLGWYIYSYWPCLYLAHTRWGGHDR